MLGLPLHYLLKHPRGGRAVLGSRPLETWTRVQETYGAQREQRGPRCRYEADENWEHRLHEQLGVPWACESAWEFTKLWPEVMRELETKGIQAGPQSFGSWNDGDAGFVRAIWCLANHLGATKIVYTAVAHSVPSRFFLVSLRP